jgi:signal peptidase II
MPNGDNKKKFMPEDVFSWCVFLFFSLFLIALDQWLKEWASVNLSGEPARSLVSGFLGFTYFHNTGAAFGFLAGHAWGMWVITALVIVLLFVVVWYYYRLPTDGDNKIWVLRVPLILIFAGGVGNLIDRLRFGYVVDMLEFLFMDFAIFNLADVYVTAGCFAMIAFIILMGKKAPWPFGADENAKPD